MSEKNANEGINEIYAQKFARAFIMPEELFIKIFWENTKTIYDEKDEEKLDVDFQSIAEKFGVPETEAFVRAKELGLIY